MVPIILDEINVFTFPHSRMRKLMNCCTSKVDHTDFTSLNDFEQLLLRLQRTFTEFMAHERIENMFVMKKLKRKLKDDLTVGDKELICNCHKTDRFSPLMNLFRDGYAFIRRGKADRMSYGIKLHKAMVNFYDDFVPHMHEEENDIQPLLSRYFTAIELKQMRIEVIKMTLQERKKSATHFAYDIERSLKIYVISCEPISSMYNFPNSVLEKIMKNLTNQQLKESCVTVNKQWSQCALKVLERRSPISQIPNEILLRLFKYYLTPKDLILSCLRVNKKWNSLTKDRQTWRTVNPINWSRDQWNTNIPLEEITNDEEEREIFKSNEIRILGGFVKYFLRDYGSLIENLILYGSLTINDNTARKIFDCCPNLKYLNIGMTKLTSKAFLHCRWIYLLESLIIEGCELMDDNLFTYITTSFNFNENSQSTPIEDKQKCLLEEPFSRSNSSDRFEICEQCAKIYSKPLRKFQLKILNLSGCFRLTDFGLNLLMKNGLTTSLTYIDLSGCVRITSECISTLLSVSSNLRTENLYFCDNIQVSSDLSMANCCQNVENNTGRYCCRRKN